MPKPLYREDLDRMRCECGTEQCNNDVIVLRSNCHPDLPTRALYLKDERVLLIVCDKCDKPIVGIAVAQNPEAQAHKELN
tara:strand:- start:319 stop:558 length:240 start_codon:yes stop_codon:yes gene_type:complete